MACFANYAQYYDLIYQNKDYKKETAFVTEQIRKYHPNARSIFELGCGTGIHATYLNKNSFDVFGIDISSEMINLANANLKQTGNQNIFELGDVRTFRTEQKFDVSISLFHVLSYQSTNKDILNMFNTANFHLKPKGIFIFDFWYGPGVLSDLPTTRVKRFENTTIKAIRIAEPLIHPNENIVDVNYTILAKNKNTQESVEIKETHSMRYLFKPELEFLLESSGFHLLAFEEWLTNKNTTFNSWNAFCVCMKNC